MLKRFILSKKEILGLNKIFDNGIVINEASLDFALSYANNTSTWTKALAYLVRAILIDHVFEEGNKRTAALLIETSAKYVGYEIYPDKLAILIKEILLKNITNIIKLEGAIKDVIK